MSSLAPHSPFLPSPATAPVDAGFFTHHGIWAPGVRLFRNLRFATKALLISLAFLVPLLALVAWLVSSGADAAMRARKDSTRQHVEIAYSVLEWAHGLETGGMPRAQAQGLAMKAVSAMRYDGKEYFWINDMHPVVLMHPIKPALDGKDASEIKDPNGLHLFSEFANVVKRSGKGFVAYQWPKPGKDKPVDKISYVQGFEPWGWVIGSGLYVDDLRDAVVADLQRVGIVVAVALLVAGYLFLSFFRVMEGGLNETRRHLRAMTDGDLTTSPSPWGKDEAAQLMRDLRAMQESLRRMVLQVRRSSDEIVHSSDEIARGALALSARTEQTAANLEQTASSMEEITATVASSAQSTAEASTLARRNAVTAAEGGCVMQEVVQKMEGISNASARISDIIGTIDGIAFQTNLLALNAAVEAARAGEQGKGFAVVANEVRVLAKRSTDAAREIKSLIASSVNQVEAGTATILRAGATIDNIVTGSSRVDELLDAVAAGAREQSLGIGQIGQAVQELDQATRQNAVLVEETAAAASAMKQQADGLAAEVSRFILPDGVAQR